MVRKLMIGAVAAVTIGFAAQTATAHDPVRGPVGVPVGPVVPVRGPIGGPIGGPVNGGFVPPRVDYDFVVYVAVRHRDHIHWERYGRYETYSEARRAERFLERQGYRVRIDEVRDRRW